MCAGSWQPLVPRSWLATHISPSCATAAAFLLFAVELAGSDIPTQSASQPLLVTEICVYPSWYGCSMTPPPSFCFLKSSSCLHIGTCCWLSFLYFSLWQISGRLSQVSVLSMDFPLDSTTGVGQLYRAVARNLSSV